MARLSIFLSALIGTSSLKSVCCFNFILAKTEAGRQNQGRFEDSQGAFQMECFRESYVTVSKAVSGQDFQQGDSSLHNLHTKALRPLGSKCEMQEILHLTFTFFRFPLRQSFMKSQNNDCSNNGDSSDSKKSEESIRKTKLLKRAWSDLDFIFLSQSSRARPTGRNRT